MSKEKVLLIVDDELIILESLKIQINRFLPDGVILEVATSGEEAFQIIDEYSQNEHLINLLISDFNLEDMKGTDIVRHLHGQFPVSRKIILTGQADAASIQNLTQDIKIDYFLTKPWDFELMKTNVLAFLGE